MERKKGADETKKTHADLRMRAGRCPMPKRAVCKSVFTMSRGRRESRNKAALGKRGAGAISQALLSEGGRRWGTVRLRTRTKLWPCAPRAVTQTGYHRVVFPRVVSASTPIRGETIPSSWCCRPDRRGKFWPGTDCWLQRQWRDAVAGHCCCVLRTACGPMQVTQTCITGKSTAKYQHPGHHQKLVSHFSNEFRSQCSSKKQECEWGKC